MPAVAGFSWKDGRRRGAGLAVHGLVQGARMGGNLRLWAREQRYLAGQLSRANLDIYPSKMGGKWTSFDAGAQTRGLVAAQTRGLVALGAGAPRF